MNVTYRIHKVESAEIVEITEKGVVISSSQDFLDIAMNLPSDYIIAYSGNFHESFFELRSGLAGEVLQKAANYSIRLAIVGDFSQYESKALRDFIYESNKSNKIVFVSSVDAALAKLMS